MNGSRRLHSALIIFMVAAVAYGCASTGPLEMVTTPAGLVHRSSRSVSVFVTGGQDKSPLGLPSISDTGFAQALRESIEKSGVFATAPPGPDGAYRLDAFIGILQQPLAGASMRVVVEVSYSLAETVTRKAVWQKSLSSEHAAAAGEAFNALTRVRIATEGAARKNIEQLIIEISKLRLE